MEHTNTDHAPPVQEIEVNATQLQSSKSPPARHLHSLVAYQGDLYLFGGLGSHGKVLNDFWKFSKGENKWIRIKAQNAPIPRNSHQAVILKHKMFVYGGVCADKKTSNELYCFNFKNESWKLVKKLDKFRSGHSMVALDNSLVIFGGADERRNLANDLFIISGKSFVMAQCDYKNLPTPRQYAAMTVLDDLIYLFGGLGYTALGDCYKISLKVPVYQMSKATVNQPTVVVPATVESVPVPPCITPSYGMTLTVSPLNDTHLVLFGGQSKNSANKHVFTFSTTNTEWHGPFTIAQCPTTRWHHQSCTIDRRMFVFGGLSENEKDGHSDLWIIGDRDPQSGVSLEDLPNEIWTHVLQNLSGNHLHAVSVTSRAMIDIINSDATLANRLKEWLDRLNITVPPIQDNRIIISFVGEMGVGKSATVVQYVQHIFVESYDPTIEDVYLKQNEVGDGKYIMELFDSIYLEEGLEARLRYYAKSHGVYAIYNVTRPETLTKLSEVLAKIKGDRGSNFPLIIVGNQLDLEADRKVSQKQGKQFAEKYGALWMETCAKSHENIKAAMDALVTLIFDVLEKQSSQGEEKEQNNSINKATISGAKTKKDRCLTM